MRTSLKFAMLLSACAVAAPAFGETTIRAGLSGYEEVPPVSTAASGAFVARVDGGTITYVLTYRNLRGSTTTGAHLHLGQAGVNGGVIAHLCGGGGQAACPPLGGSVSGTITAAQIAGPSGQGIDAMEMDEVLAAIRAGVTYVNVHTDLHLGGEIRGQVK